MVSLARPVTDASHYVRGFIPGEHRGIDYGWSSSQWEESHRVLASLGGRVEYVYSGGGYNQGWGNRIGIDHGYGIATYYNHLDETWVSVGQQVEVGRQIGVMGTTGASTGDHLHFELYINGVRVDPEPYRNGLALPGIPEGSGGGAIGLMQRRFTVYGFRRAAPTTLSAKIVVDGEDGVGAGEIGNFIGWTRGQVVEGNDIWFLGVSGGWFWAGVFETGSSTTGLPEVPNPNIPNPSDTPTLEYQRVVRTEGVYERAQPTTLSVTTREFVKYEVLDFDAWTQGQSVTVDGITSDIWFRGAYAKLWFAAACFTSQATTGLMHIEIFNPSDGLDPRAPWKTQTPDSTYAEWIGSPNYNYRTASEKDHITLHWMVGYLTGTDATFQNPGEIVKGRGTNASTQYGVNDDHIHQYVLEKDYAHGDGNAESNAKGISIEHEGGYIDVKTGKVVEVSRKTLENSAKLCADIAWRKGWRKLVWMSNVFPHNHWVATQCPGSLDYEYLILIANRRLEILWHGSPEPEPDPDPEPIPDDKVLVDKSWLVKLRQDLDNYIG